MIKSFRGHGDQVEKHKGAIGNKDFASAIEARNLWPSLSQKGHQGSMIVVECAQLITLSLILITVPALSSPTQSKRQKIQPHASTKKAR